MIIRLHRYYGSIIFWLPCKFAIEFIVEKNRR